MKRRWGWIALGLAAALAGCGGARQTGDAGPARRRAPREAQVDAVRSWTR